MKVEEFTYWDHNPYVLANMWADLESKTPREANKLKKRKDNLISKIQMTNWCVTTYLKETMNQEYSLYKKAKAEHDREQAQEKEKKTYPVYHPSEINRTII